MNTKKNKNYLRELPSVPFTSRQMPPALEAFCNDHILPDLEIGGYRQDQKRATVTYCVLALIRAALADKVVADSRDTGKAGIRQRVQAWDLLEKAGYCMKSVGSEQSGFSTRYQATKKLMRLKKLWSQEMYAQPDQKPDDGLCGLVIYKRRIQKKGLAKIVPPREIVEANAERGPDGKPYPEAVEHGLRAIRERENTLNAINGVNMSHSWMTTNEQGIYFQPDLRLRETHIQKPYRGVRYYTSTEVGGQGLPKASRRRMLLDGEAVAELDFSGSIPRIAKHLRRIDVSADEDVYALERVLPDFSALTSAGEYEWEVVRDFVKRVTLICFNVGSRKEANQTVGGVLNEHPEIDLLHDVFYRVEMLMLRGGLVRNLVDRIAEVHEDIRDYLFCNRGMELVTVESRIMLWILQEFVLEQKRPALPIHDALVVRRSDTAMAKQAMEEAYDCFCPGFPPFVKVI